MKKLLFIIMIFSIFTGLSIADVKKKTKSKVEFNKFGTYTIEVKAKISKTIKRTDSKTNFKGKGIAGRLVGKFIKKGNSGEILNLSELLRYSLNHKKKEYTVSPIEKIEWPVVAGGEKGNMDKNKQEGLEYKSNDQVKIIRSEFRVDDTGEKKKINKFPCQKFILLVLTEWEDTRTGQRGIDSLSTILWMTEFTDELNQAQEEEMEFTKAHLKAMGMDVDEMYDDILGTNWLSLLGKFTKKEKESKPTNPKLVKEMEKLKGYPVIIDGKYFNIRPKPEGENENMDNQETDDTDVKKSLGRFARGLLKKKNKGPKGPQASFSYRTELIEYALTNFSGDDLQVDAKYKEKK